MKKIVSRVLCLALFMGLLLALIGSRAEIPAEETQDIPCLSDDETPAEPTAAPDGIEAQARALLEEMSDEEKAWQMIMVYPEQLLGKSYSTDEAEWAEALEKRPAGGIFFASANMPSEEILKNMLEIINSTGRGIFLALDEEGGSVARLSYTLGKTTDFLPMYEYKDQGEATAYANALTIARDISSFGFNLNFAPVADVWTNPANTVIGRRAYSDEPEQAAELVAAAVRGLAQGGVISTLKHFPGHGDTTQDSHNEAAISEKTLAELKECEFLPFISGIEAGAGMVMVGHITLTEIDPFMPATLSRTIVTGLLRGELGFDGVVITDAFAMEALGDFDNTQAALMAIEAGCDMILCPKDPDAVVQAILKNISLERIEQSVMRILMLKLEYGLH